MGNHPTLELNENGNFECLGHSNWTICITLSPSSSKIIPTFPLSYWEANSYYPTRLIIQLKNLMGVVTFWAWCKVCGLLTQRCSKISTTSFHGTTGNRGLCSLHCALVSDRCGKRAHARSLECSISRHRWGKGESHLKAERSGGPKAAAAET